jgi:renalase
MAGLSAGRALTTRGAQVVILDKGRGPGGRMATRRLTGLHNTPLPCDHGAQFFTVRSKPFQAQVDVWIKSGHVVLWATRFPHADGNRDRHEEPRYVGAFGMNALAKDLATGLDVRCSQTVVNIHPSEQGYRVVTQEGPTFEGRAVLVTAPVPQALSLLDASGLGIEATDALRRLTYAPCLAVALTLDGPTNLPAPGGLRFTGEPLAWMADGRAKKAPGNEHSVVLHAAPAFSATHFRQDREKAADLMIRCAASWIGPGNILHRHIHGWLYSTPLAQDTQTEKYRILHHHPPLMLAGDGFSGGRIEGAYLSGLEAAHALATGRDADPPASILRF